MLTISISAQRVSGPQIKEARRLLAWTQSKLAGESGLSLPSIKRAEAGNATSEVLALVIATLRAKGVEFIPGGAKLSAPQPTLARSTGVEAGVNGASRRSLAPKVKRHKSLRQQVIEKLDGETGQRALFLGHLLEVRGLLPVRKKLGKATPA